MTENHFNILQSLVYKNLKLIGSFYRLRKDLEDRGHQGTIAKAKGI